jgi:hypothetical protein
MGTERMQLHFPQLAEQLPRLNRQHARILERLQAGPATNYELAAIALRYSARIHELRKHGHAIATGPVDRDTGVAIYTLEA